MKAPVLLLTVKDVRKQVAEWRREGLTVGFVPTMGALHKGHLSLMEQSRMEMDRTIVSIFVNPLQFGPSEDFENYPRDLTGDMRKMASVGVDAVFFPSSEEMYPDGFRTHVEVEGLSAKLCGKFRPGHFRGVATVCCKLFNIVQADKAYFGQKDAQQVLILKTMVKDLNIPTEIVVLPTVREDDGLAMSSRNVYLKPEERQRALCIPKALRAAEILFGKGERSAVVIRCEMERIIMEAAPSGVDYIAVVHPDTLEDIDEIEGKALVAVAVRIGAARLIDNVLLG